MGENYLEMISTLLSKLCLEASFFFSLRQVEGWQGGSGAVLQIPHGWKFPGDPGRSRGGCWEVHCPGTNPGTRTLPESHTQTCGQW